MGWSEVAARSHGKRLETEGWLARYPMTRGSGSLFVATRTGLRVAGSSLRAPGPPAPTWWAHHCACAWAAAFLEARGDTTYLAERELLDEDAWSGRIRWTDHKGFHEAGHRPDLVSLLDGWSQPAEVELARKSMARLQAIIGLHARWRAQGRTRGVVYICGDEDVTDRVRRAAAKAVGADWPGLMTLQLSDIHARAIEKREQRRARPEESMPTADPATREVA